MAQFAINNAWHSSIQTTPFYLNHGRHPSLPTSLIEESRVPAACLFTDNITSALVLAKQFIVQARQKSYADTRRKPVHFIVGNKVLLSSKNLKFTSRFARKLLPKFVGPFPVTQVFSKGVNARTIAVRLQLPENWKIHDVFHVSLVSFRWYTHTWQKASTLGKHYWDSPPLVKQKGRFRSK